MKKVLLILCSVAILISCQKEQINEEITSGLTANIDKSTEKYFGVFVSTDLELHGEIRVKKVKDNQYEATVTLINSEVLQFSGAQINLTSDIEFTGERGSFIINFSDKENMVSTQFIVDGKDGIVKTYPDTRAGGGIAFGTYAQDGVPGFVGTWDMITFGIPEPGHPGFFMIEDIFILHKDTHALFDTTAGIFETFADLCININNHPVWAGGATDGTTVIAVDQVATIAGATGHWSMLSLSPVLLGFEPVTCNQLPPGIDGIWEWGGKTGTLTRL